MNFLALCLSGAILKLNNDIFCQQSRHLTVNIQTSLRSVLSGAILKLNNDIITPPDGQYMNFPALLFEWCNFGIDLCCISPTVTPPGGKYTNFPTL